jgi:hypothetical protein
VLDTHVTDTGGMADVRDQLAAVARARGVSLRSLVQEMAAQTLSPEHIRRGPLAPVHCSPSDSDTT